MKSYRPYSPDQSELFPPSPREWLPEGHLAYFVLDVVCELDLKQIEAHYEREPETRYRWHRKALHSGYSAERGCSGSRKS